MHLSALCLVLRLFVFELKHIMGIADDLARLQASKFTETMAANTELRSGVLDFINSSTPAQVREFIKSLGDNQKALEHCEQFMLDVVANLDNSWRLTTETIDAGLQGKL